MYFSRQIVDDDLWISQVVLLARRSHSSVFMYREAHWGRAHGSATKSISLSTYVRITTHGTLATDDGRVCLPLVGISVSAVCGVFHAVNKWPREYALHSSATLLSVPLGVVLPDIRARDVRPKSASTPNITLGRRVQSLTLSA